MKRRFLNQKLGKRNSRRAEIIMARQQLNMSRQLQPRKEAEGRLDSASGRRIGSGHSTQAARPEHESPRRRSSW